MTSGLRRMIAVLMVLAVSVPVVEPLRAQAPVATPNPQNQSQQQGSFVMKVNAELVLTNVVARDTKTGELVH